MCLEIDESPKYRCTDDMAKKKILAAFGTYTPVITRKNRDFINASTRKVIREGVSIRQLSRLTGMSKRIIEKALK